MENYQGDLTDIVRGSSGRGAAAATGDVRGSVREAPVVTDWQFPSDDHHEHINFVSGMELEPSDFFGDPFSCSVSDPLLQELDINPATAGSGFFNSSNSNNSSANIIKTGAHHEDGVGFLVHRHHKMNLDHEDLKRPACNNIFSRMLQISPEAAVAAAAQLPPCASPTVVASSSASPRGLTPPSPPPLFTNDIIGATTSSKTTCLIDNTALQISSPRNSGIKRRKSQAKKVVCIPAPAPANSRPGGEVVPSDLWAWRKYGQKPIKGSPHPRGYYRCSSSKGCSARKQVERSRTDPNMLVVTYTSEHNHPWPTQRNALAGSTRTQPSKNNSATKASAGSQSKKTTTTTTLKEEEKESNTLQDQDDKAGPPPVKGEMKNLHKHPEMEEGGGDFITELFPDHLSYRPAMPDHPIINHSEDFFAHLGEIEADPLKLLFTQGFSADVGRENNKALNPFSFYDWPENSNSGRGSNSTAFGEAKRGL